MNENITKTTDPIWDSRNSQEPGDDPKSDTPRTDAIFDKSPTASFWWPDFARTFELELATERARAEQAEKQFGTCSVCGFCAWKNKDKTTEECQYCLAEARLADSCFHLKCAGRLIERMALDEDYGVDGDECLEQHRNIEAFLSLTTTPSILAELERLRAELKDAREAIAKLSGDPAAFSSSEAFRVPEPHDMDCSSRRGDYCDCGRSKATNKSDTPRTEAELPKCYFPPFGFANFTRGLERELNAARAELAKWEEGFRINADALKDALRHSDKQRLEILNCKARIAELTKLNEPIWDARNSEEPK